MLSELGHDVMDASSGAQALQILGSETAFDLLVTDYSMPSMTGVELIAKEKESGNELGTLIVSGYSDVNERFDIPGVVRLARSEEHTSELKSLMRRPYAVFCLKNI